MAYLVNSQGRQTDFSGSEETRRTKDWKAAFNFQAALFKLIDQATQLVKTDQQPREIWAAFSAGIRSLVIVPQSQRAQFLREPFGACLVVKISPETNVAELKAEIEQSLPAVYRRYQEVC
jgi:hypothetical protein